jgi:hypothetical protein
MGLDLKGVEAMLVGKNVDYNVLDCKLVRIIVTMCYFV